MRTGLLIVTVLWLAPRLASAQADAGVPPPTPSTPHTEAGAPSLSPGDVAAHTTGRADSLGPIDQTEVAIRQAEDWLADGQRRDAIHHGDVDGYYLELGRSMRGSFHPDLVAITDERRRGMSLPEIAMDELGRYGPPEAPRGPSSVYTPEMRATTGEDRQMQEQFDIHSLLNAHTRWTRVEVHVIQDRAGHVLSATVTHSSDSHTLDAAALAAITSAALTSPPPARVLGERQTIDSDWSFWAGEVVPFLGDAGCTESSDGQGLQCSALGRPMLRTRVVLLDVHDAEHERAEREHTDVAHTHARPHHAPAHEGEHHDGPVRDASPDLPAHALAPPGAP